MSSESPRDRLPFEPRQKKKKSAKKAPVQAEATPEKPARAAAQKPERESLATAIPKAVSKRMIRRMAIFCGFPTGLGISTFFISYWIVNNQLFELPTSAVVLVSMGCFGLGVVGLSYGLFSASWDEDRVGSLLGWNDFSLNFGRTIRAWRNAKQ